MPTIPTYDNPTVATQPLPAVRQQIPNRMLLAASIGPEQQVKLGQSIQNFGNGVHQAAAAEADANLIGAIQGVLYGTPDNPNSGYLNQKGKNAVDTYQDTVKALQNLAPDQAKNLSPEAAGLAQTSTNLRVQSAIAQITQHNSQQTGVYQQAAGATRVKAASDSAALSYNPLTDKPSLDYDPKSPEASTPYQLNLRTIQAEANSLADLQGIRDPDLRSAFIKEQMGQAYVSTLAHMIDGSKGKNLNGSTLKIAQGYFDSIKDNLTAAQQDKIQGVLKAGALQDTVLSYSDQLMDTHKSETAQLKQIRADFEAGKISGVEREQIESRINHLHAQARSLDDQNTASLQGQVQDWIIKNPGKDITALPTVLYTQLMHKGMLATADAFAQRTTKESDKKYYVSAFSGLGTGGENDIAKLSDSEWGEKRTLLSPTDFTKLDKMRADFKEGKPINGKDPGNINIGKFNNIFNNRLPKLNKKGAEYSETYAAVKDAVIQDQHIAGHVFNDEQLAKSIDSYLKDTITVPGTLWGTNETSLYKAHVKEVPLSDERRIREAFVKNKGRQPTAAEITQVYQAAGNKHD